MPLHRRGTSKTYERLEDLLREAGYKETRVFTPEGERGESGSSGEHGVRPNADHGSVRGGVGAVVGFLAGLIPGAPSVSRSSSVQRADASKERQNVDEPIPSSSLHTYSPPVSPLTLRQTQKQKQKTAVSSESHSPTGMTSSIESLEPTPQAKRRPPTHYAPHQEQQRPSHQLVHRVSDQYSHASQRNRGSRTSLHQQVLSPPASPKYIAQPRPSRAGAYLRHMASAPNMPKRPSSTPVHPPPRRQTLISDSDTDDAVKFNENELEEPPLPRTWLESVARAVLFGGMGAYVGGPAGPPTVVDPASFTPHARALRPTRSSLSQVSLQQGGDPRSRTPRSGLSNRTNTHRFSPNDLLAPPELFTRIERGRAGKSAGEVTRTRVVCRSAPASRANSRVRGGSRDGSREKRARPWKERKGKDSGERRLPSLASTQAEGDAWTRGRDRVATSGGGNRYLSGWGVEPDSEDDGDAEDRQSSSEDDEELDLARILVPPKRQNSIKSLRKHLAANEDTGSSAAANLMKAAVGLRSGREMTTGSARARRSESTRQRIREDNWDGGEAEEWGGGWVKKDMRRRSSEDDDDDETYAGFLATGRGGGVRGSGLGSGRSATGRSRLGLPRPWGLIGGGS